MKWKMFVALKIWTWSMSYSLNNTVDPLWPRLYSHKQEHICTYKPLFCINWIKAPMLLLHMIMQQVTKDKVETDLHSYWMGFKRKKKRKKKKKKTVTFQLNAPFKSPTTSPGLQFRIYCTRMLFKGSFCLEVHSNSEHINIEFYLYIHTEPLQGVNIIFTGLTTLLEEHPW